MTQSLEPRAAYVFIGFGSCAEEAARTLLRRGTPAARFLVLAETDAQLEQAEYLGLPGRRESDFSSFEPFAAGRIIVDLSDLGAALEAVRKLHAVARATAIAVAVRRPESVELLRSSGATDVICPASLGAVAIAETVLPSEPRNGLLN